MSTAVLCCSIRGTDPKTRPASTPDNHLLSFIYSIFGVEGCMVGGGTGFDMEGQGS